MRTFRVTQIERTALVTFVITSAVLSNVAYAQTKPALPSVPTTTTYKSVILERALQEFCQKTGVNVISDAYPGETYPMYPVRWESLPPKEAIEAIARDSGHEIVVVNGLYILRSRSWAQMYLDTYRNGIGPRPHAPATWSDSGFITVERLDPPEDAEFVQPAQRVRVSARHASCALVAAQLNQKAAYNVTVEPDLKTRRVHVFVKDISPSALIGGIAYLVNGGPEIVLKQSDVQKKAEKYAQFSDKDRFKKRVIQSDKLRDKVEAILTKEQKEALEKGESVEMSVQSLPDSLKKEALDYIMATAKVNEELVHPPAPN